MLAMFAGPALALRSLQSSNPGAVSLTGANVSFEDEAGFLREVCSGVTLAGEVIERIGKVAGTAVGSITEGRATACRAFGFVEAAVTIEASTRTPFPETYNGFLGTLPTITGVLILIGSVRFTTVAAGRTCRYEGRVGFLIPVTREARGALIYEGGSFLAEPKLRILAGSTAECPREGSLRGSLRFERTRTITLLNEAPAVWVVSVGDSYISGEGSRWAGNTNREEARIDALGRNAYFDSPEGTRETIERCHRSKEPEIRIGGAGVTSVNFACSGATVATRAGPPFKPGLDRVANSQLELLRDLATRHPRQIKLVAVSIGGNDFGFGEIVEACVQAYLAAGRRLCSTEAAVTERVNAANVAAKTALIARAILEVRETMRNAGSADGEYRIVVQNYESPVPLGPGFRYAQEEEEGGGNRKNRSATGKCGFWDADAEWANNTALVQINRAVADAVTATRLANVVPLKLETAFEGRRLCEMGVNLIENTELALGTEAGGADRLEWINQIRIVVLFTEYFIQESLHPNYWAVLALRNCLRRTYVGGRAAATCTRNGAGLEGGEPRMQIR
ncbi:MAG TPA: hypothetical protein VE972_08980 [Conexibacter sp.]|nr:hypothetical protein [Conexibacter sp.]